PVLQRTADRRRAPLHRVRLAGLVAVNQVPHLGRRLATVRRHPTRAVAGQVLDELAARRGPALRVGTHRTQNRPVQTLRQRRDLLARRTQVVLHLLHPRVQRAARTEWQLARYHLVERGAETVDVAADVGVLGVAELLRGHEVRRAQAAA